MMAGSQVSVGGSLTYAWTLLRQNWRSIWAVLALVSLAETVYVAGAYAPNNGLLIAGFIAQLAAQPMLYAAVFRLAFADRHPGDPAFALGHSGLQWRAMEWRVLGAMALFSVFMSIIAVLGLLLVAGIALGIIATHGGPAPPKTPQAVLDALGQDGQAVVLVVVVLALSAIIYFAVRLGLAFAATADTGKISVLGTWGLTRSHFWRILLALILVELPLTFLQSLIAALADGGGAVAGAATQMSAESALFSALILGAAFGCLIGPLSVGVLAYYYKNPSGPAPGRTS